MTKKKTKKLSELEKFEYEYYIRERESYIREKYKNENFLDNFIAIVSVIGWIISLSERFFIPSCYFGIVLILTVLNSYRAKQAFSEAIRLLDEKDTSENKYCKSNDDFLSMKILYFFAGIISFSIQSL